MGEVVVVVPWVGVAVQLSLEVEVGMVVVGKLDRQESQNCKQKSLRCEQSDRVGGLTGGQWGLQEELLGCMVHCILRV